MPDAPQNHQLAELDSGLRVVTERMPSVRSVALGLWVRTGSRDELVEQAGISHFLEHLLFKGTERFSSEEIDQIFDGMGAEVNAGTSKETTSVYARCLDRHLERSLEVIADMMLAPAYRDVDSERQVVIEEIAMYEDEPSDKVHDVLAGAVFGDHPLGRPIIGSADVVGSVPVPDIAAYHSSRYVGPNLVLAAAGNLEHEQVVAQAERLLGGRSGEPANGSEPVTFDGPAVRFHTKDTEQYHLALGGPGFARGDDRRFALRVLDTLLGGSSSSRLFQEVREKRGLAYAVYSYASSFADIGQVGVYVGTRRDNVGEALGIVGDQLRRLQDQPVPADELDRAKENVKGRTVLSMESTLARMNRLGSSVLMDVPILSLDELLAEIDAVTAEDVAELARTAYGPASMSAAGVGPDESVFRDALAGAELAAA
ncbi:MAG TPA: pitrilysin family protein [Thermoleophilaceae bacterium]|nr:pitrilysin family protein [Thermoleophilaceae bacterium]